MTTVLTIFVYLSPQARVTKANINKRESIKLKSFCTAKKNINKMKRQPIEWEKIFANDISNKWFLSKIHKELIQLKIKIKKYLVIFCLLFSFVDYVPVKGEIIWYLSLTTWFISLSIMLSSSIHDIAKGRSSFFLSAV